MKALLTCTLLLALCFQINSTMAQNTINAINFQTPPNSTKVNTWWHWINGNITRDGITKDLESMKQQGISEATILNVGSWTPMEIVKPPVKFYTEEWFDMYKWALEEANRLGITIGVHNCDGWSTSGGPWITPEQSMKQYVWTKTTIEGGKDIQIQLEKPQALHDFYRDAAVVAFPVNEKLNSYQQAKPKVALDKADAGTVLNDGNPLSELKIKTGEAILVSFSSEFSADKLAIFPRMVFDWADMTKIKSRFTLSASNDGVNYQKIKDIKVVGVNQSLSFSFPETKSKYFKLDCDSSWAEYAISELELLKATEEPAWKPQISGFLEKICSVKAVGESKFGLTADNAVNSIPESSIIDLTKLVSPEGVLNWKAPKGIWRIIRFGYTTTGKKNGPATPEGTGLEVDKMDSEALDFHFNSFAGKLIQASGKYTGNTFKFLLIDSWECFFQNWTAKFPQEFKTRRGYDLTPWIPVLCGEVVENTKLSDAFLHDFSKTISDLIDVKYFSHFKDLCHQNKLEMHAEIVYGNNGDYPALDILRSNKYPDMPMTEFWATPNKNQFPEYQPTDRPTPGFPTYAALACNKQIIGSEAYTGYAHYSESPADLKPFGDAAFCQGINQIILHSYVLQAKDLKPGATLMKFAAHFNRNNPWWEFSKGWMDYQARIQYVLQQGEPIVDVIFYAGDQLPQYFSKSIINDLPYGTQANACNFEMLQQAKVIDGRISFGGKQSFPILTLPNTTTMELATLKQIARLVNNGAVIYGPKPMEMLSVSEIKNNAPEFKKLADDLWGKTPENKYGKGKVISGKPIAEVLKKLGVLPDLTTSSNDPKEIMFIHKRMGDTDVYFIFNQQNKPMNRELVFRVAGKTPEIWNPENGAISKPAVFAIDQNQTRIPLSFKAYESKMIVFRNEKPLQFIQDVSLSGKQIFPQLQFDANSSEIPQATFTKGKFNFLSNQSGEYSFTTNENQIVKKNLFQEKSIEIENYKGKIEFFPISDEVIAPIEIAKLKSLTEFNEPAIKYFAGKAKYTISFASPNSFLSASDSIVLNLGELDATAEVRLNGKLLAYVWMPSTELDVSGLLKTENTLEITVANVCRNRFIGDLIQYGKVKSLFTTSPITEILNKDMPLKPSGLMGPLKLMKYIK
jgi:hypothetical protein